MGLPTSSCWEFFSLAEHRTLLAKYTVLYFPIESKAGDRGVLLMSFGIVRVQKFKAADVKGIQSHDRRERDSRSNPDIDKAKSAENYSLVSSDNLSTAIQGRIDSLEMTKAVRKDAVVMAQLLVTSDHDFFKNLTPEKEKAFFQQSLKFIEDRYGKENVLSATVHKDEKTPHMHVNLTPIKGQRLSAKALFDRNELKSLHTDFNRSVGQSWGLQRGESREEKRKHLDTEAFKLQTKKDQLKERMEEMTKSSAWIRADDVQPKVLEKKLLGLSRVEESPEGIARRLNENFIQPMANRVNESARESKQMRQENADLRQEVGQQKAEIQELQAFQRQFGGTLKPEQQKVVLEQINQFKAENAVESQRKMAEFERQKAALEQAQRKAEERKRVELEVSRYLRNTSGTVGQHMEQNKQIMEQWDKAPDKKAFEKAVAQHFGKNKDQEMER